MVVVRVFGSEMEFIFECLLMVLLQWYLMRMILIRAANGLKYGVFKAAFLDQSLPY